MPLALEVFALLLALRHLRQQPGQQCPVQRIVLRGLRIHFQRELALHHFHHLRVHVVPFGEPQVREEVLLAPGPQLGARQVLALLGPRPPQFEQRQEVRLLVAQQRVFLVRLGLFVRRSVARIRHRQRRGDDRDFFEAVLVRARQQHAAEPRIERQPRQLPARYR